MQTQEFCFSKSKFKKKETPLREITYATEAQKVGILFHENYWLPTQAN